MTKKEEINREIIVTRLAMIDQGLRRLYSHCSDSHQWEMNTLDIVCSIEEDLKELLTQLGI